MIGYDFRPAVIELLCNNSLANMAQCIYTLGLKWNLDSAYLTDDMSPGRGQTEKKKCTAFVNAEMEIVFLFVFVFFVFFFISYFLFYFMYIGRWSSETPRDCHFLGSLLQA